MDPQEIKKNAADLLAMLIQGAIGLNTIQGI
jgi:hypothetical protein